MPPKQDRNLQSMKCEDCTEKYSSYGLPTEKKRRWCSVCARAHPGAISVTFQTARCEDCSQKRASFGLLNKPRRQHGGRGAPGEGRARWCGSCAKAHGPGVGPLYARMCEDCGRKSANFVVPCGLYPIVTKFRSTAHPLNIPGFLS